VAAAAALYPTDGLNAAEPPPEGYVKRKEDGVQRVAARAGSMIGD